MLDTQQKGLYNRVATLQFIAAFTECAGIVNRTAGALSLLSQRNNLGGFQRRGGRAMLSVVKLGNARVYVLTVRGKCHTFANRSARRLFG